MMVVYECLHKISHQLAKWNMQLIIKRILIRITGENEKKEVKLITEKLCKRNDIITYRTRYSPVYIDFSRRRGSASSFRGYVIGVQMYDFENGMFQISCTHSFRD